jgi:CheY-like chemotaxis protein
MAHILIVDDDPAQRTLLGLCFLHFGHSIVVAGEGAAALARLAAQPVDLVITDLRMPVLDGLALLRQARAAGWRDLPIIVVTGQADARAAALAAGATAFLIKPVPMPELRALVERLLAVRPEVRADA